MHDGVLTVTSPCMPDRFEPPGEIPNSTDLRAMVMTVLRGHPGPINVYALLAIVNRRTGTRRHANSIYRIVNHLVASDLAIYVVSWKRYMAKPAGCGPMPLLLLCRCCEGAEVVANAGIEQDVTRLAITGRFDLRNAHLEITGTCRRCLA